MSSHWEKCKMICCVWLLPSWSFRRLYCSSLTESGVETCVRTIIQSCHNCMDLVVTTVMQDTIHKWFSSISKRQTSNDLEILQSDNDLEP